jgi:hypothetical protein
MLEDNIKLDIGKISCVRRKWIEPAHGCVFWRVFGLTVLNLQVLLSEFSYEKEMSAGM